MPFRLHFLRALNGLFCRLFGLEPVIVQGGEAEGILTPPEPEKLAALFAADEDICGIIAVSPDYYGVVAPLEKYAEIVGGVILIAIGIKICVEHIFFA